MVVVCISHLLERVLVTPQRHRMDEDQAVPLEAGQLCFHWYRHSGPTLLDSRDICQLCLFSRSQHHLPENKALGSTLSGSLVDHHYRLPVLDHQNAV